MTDWREQAYEDAYWDERSALLPVVSMWDTATTDLFLRAVEQAGATRAEERAEVVSELLS